MNHDPDIARLFHDGLPPSPPPQTAWILQVGRRQVRRRATMAAGGVVLSVLAIVPFGWALHDAASGRGTPATQVGQRSQPPQRTTASGVTSPPSGSARIPCALGVCLNAVAGRARADALGHVIDAGASAAGRDVLVFALSGRVHHPPAAPVQGPIVYLGFVAGNGKLLPEIGLFTPSQPFAQQLPLPMAWSVGPDGWVLWGDVPKASVGAVTAVMRPGATSPDVHTSSVVLPGQTIFWMSGASTDLRDLPIRIDVTAPPGGTGVIACAVQRCGVTGW